MNIGSLAFILKNNSSAVKHPAAQLKFSTPLASFLVQNLVVTKI
jgi:hypothetical protein